MVRRLGFATPSRYTRRAFAFRGCIQVCAYPERMPGGVRWHGLRRGHVGYVPGGGYESMNHFVCMGSDAMVVCVVLPLFYECSVRCRLSLE